MIKYFKIKYKIKVKYIKCYLSGVSYMYVRLVEA